jgi:ubiquinone/menaquinone biosynthesis C-methylase UbiE
MYDRMTGPSERRLFANQRPRLLGDLSGRVLEIGVGTGASLPYYPATAEVVGTEPDPYMLQRARRRLAGLERSNIELRRAPAEDLPFEPGSFDHAVSTLVLCTVRDPERALAELRRVLKPAGSLRFMEHVRNDRSRPWGAVQDVIAPAWRWLGAGCNPNRRTQQAIEGAGFRIEAIEEVHMAPGTYAIVGRALRG